MKIGTQKVKLAFVWGHRGQSQSTYLTGSLIGIYSTPPLTYSWDALCPQYKNKLEINLLCQRTDWLKVW